MINLNDCIEIGLLTRPHGIKGHMVLKLNNFSFDNIKEMELVFLIIDGLPVPFFIEEFFERNKNTLVVKLDDVISEDEARKYSESIVYLPKEVLLKEENQELSPEVLKGFSVIDKIKGEVGIFDTILEFNQNPVMRVLKGRTEILIPYQKEFILEIDDVERVVRIDCPDGLLDLYM